MAPHALGEAVACDPVQTLGMADRVVDRRGPQRPGVSQEALGIAGRYVTVPPANGRHPAVALEWQHQAAPAVLRRLAEGHDALPIGRGVIVRDGKDAGGIAEIDANCGLLWQWSADRLQQSESEGAASGGVDDEIRRNRLARAVAVLVAHAGDRFSIWRRQYFLDPTALAQRGVRAVFHPPSHGARCSFCPSWTGSAWKRSQAWSARLDAYLRDHLFAPLGMTDTAFRIGEAQRQRLVGMHARGSDGSLKAIPFEVEQDPEFHGGGGGLYGTAAITSSSPG